MQLKIIRMIVWFHFIGQYTCVQKLRMIKCKRIITFDAMSSVSNNFVAQILFSNSLAKWYLIIISVKYVSLADIPFNHIVACSCT